VAERGVHTPAGSSLTDFCAPEEEDLANLRGAQLPLIWGREVISPG
jgi:hypothetical protein